MRSKGGLMHTAFASKPSQAHETLHRLPLLELATAMIVAAGCHDAPTVPSTPETPVRAVNSNGVWLVNALDDPGDGTCANNECTLREAIAAAQFGDRITFKSNLNGTINLTAGEIVVEKALTIDGPGADVLTVSGQNASRIFRIGNSVDSIIVVVSGLTIADGKSFNEGGGIHVTRAARVIVLASLITRNSASKGGGIYSDGTLTVAGSTIAWNEAMAGGGIYNFDGRLTVARSTISLNVATTGAGGGGIFTACQTAWCTQSAIRSSTITRNEAPTLAGGLAIDANATSLANTIIAGNHSGVGLDTEADCSGAGQFLTSLGYNLSTLGTGCKLAAPTDVNLTLASQLFSQVLFFPLIDNGGRLPTHALIERGLAVDAGYCPGETADQRAFPRPYDDLRVPNALDGCDMGAFEWNPASTKGNGQKP
jgi:CSLREA domain-containing protein